ncbi:spore germination protein [Peribacillus simplex]|uniref:Spore germination protein n=1 Tax=Peribacillus simplex NBRC 15720 = DSM 1321 TaxID=1349754 RepID=A0A223ENJ2_9BACI|nr:spore germination protein [Peribacillus simplex]ASS96715.1 spore germination protein [Peribacillus simplex NBRC 15720 = DSM 1321]MEC1395871.1 spore germination protein [Peribacillus simplex]
MSFFKKQRKNSVNFSSFEQDDQNKEENKDLLKTSLQGNIQHVKQQLGNSGDIVIREIQIGKEGIVKACIFYTDGLVDTNSIQNFIMESLMLDIHPDQKHLISSQQNVLQVLKDRILAVGDIQDVTGFSSLLTSLLSGDVILLLDGYTQGFTIGMRGGKDRGVMESTTETVVRGPKEGFTENLRTNTALIRRKIKTPRLWLESKKIGKLTKTDVAIMYIDGIVNDKVVEEVHKRLDRIDIDGILESGYIEELIQDETYSPFPTIYYSERPDVIAAELLEGKVAILVDGTPIVLVVPALFISFIQSAEDYYQRADISTLIRMLRFIAIFIALLGPSLYIAITTYHQEMLPTPLLINLASQREGVPFPAFIEALMMEGAFEILREAGLRMPKAIGQAISIVGTLVIGTAAVEAGIVSAAMVIVVAITAISSFVLPAFSLSMSIRMLRFPMMALAASFGIFGLVVGFIALVLHLCSLRSFGVPYMSPFGPFIRDDMKDTFIRVPRLGMFSRPRLISQKNNKREQNSVSKSPRNKM